jgi:hypothetical protein
LAHRPDILEAHLAGGGVAADAKASRQPSIAVVTKLVIVCFMYIFMISKKKKEKKIESGKRSLLVKVKHAPELTRKLSHLCVVIASQCNLCFSALMDPPLLQIHHSLSFSSYEWLSTILNTSA